jgi:hypothetical protein
LNQSSANEFGRLANGVGSRIKKPPTQSNSSENRMYHETTETI